MAKCWAERGKCCEVEQRKSLPSLQFSSIVGILPEQRKTQTAGTFTKKTGRNKSQREQGVTVHNSTVTDPQSNNFVPNEAWKQFNPRRDAAAFARPTTHSGQGAQTTWIRRYPRKPKELGCTAQPLVPHSEEGDGASPSALLLLLLPCKTDFTSRCVTQGLRRVRRIIAVIPPKPSYEDGIEEESVLLVFSSVNLQSWKWPGENGGR